MRCKVNNAVIVKKITPKRPLGRKSVFSVENAGFDNKCGLYPFVMGHKALDKKIDRGIIIFT
jgi:hypothetical protein